MKPQASRDAIKWFRSTAKAVQDVNVNRVMEETPSRMYSRIGPNDIGEMFAFFYDPKWKEKLPYWDQHPLILPFSFTNKGFTAFNLHYLSVYQRAKILDGLYRISEKSNGKVQRLNVNYQLLKSMSRFGPLKGCIKSYLWDHVMSRFFWVRPTEFDIAIALPTARFVGSTPLSVQRKTYRDRWTHGV